MAKESMKARERKRARMVELQKDKRAALKAAGDWTALQKMPRNGSKVRMYTLGALLGLLCLWALLNLCEITPPEKNGRSRWLVLYVLCAAAGMYTLYYFVFLLLTLNLLALLLLRTQTKLSLIHI